MKMRTGTILAAAALVVAALSSMTTGCELIASVDRTLINAGSGGSGGAGGSTSSVTSTTSASGSGGGTTSSSSGTGGSMCVDPVKDCPKPAGECVTAACDGGGLCAVKNVAEGGAVTAQTMGDCKKVVCDGAGATHAIDDNMDVGDDSNDCTKDACSAGASTHTPLAIDTVCTSNAGKFCDAAGACLECNQGTQCASGICQASKCVPATCTDLVQNGAETDKDCGGAACNKCGTAKKCLVALDCADGVCDGTLHCAAPSCTDTVKNGTETDIDCGATCGAGKLCGTNKICATGADCTDGVCDGTLHCAAATCTDMTKNGMETGIDCSGTCPSKCPYQQGCVGNTDCIGGTCTSSVCVATCTDTAKNGTETDIDCGGSCSTKCGFNKTCALPADCQTGVCTTLKCAAATCSDGVKNNGESDIDCGGANCNPCFVGKACTAAGYCSSNVCTTLACAPNALCVNGVKDMANGETDTDCGGGKCNTCVAMQACLVPSDCASGTCTGNVCL